MAAEQLAQPVLAYVDTKDDLLLDCRLNPHGAQCGLATLLGVMSSYILPLMLGLCLASNGMVIYVCTARLHLESRFSVYLSAFCLCDTVQSLTWGLVWVFPARGVPFMTRGRAGFLLMNVSDTACKAARFVQAFTAVSVIIVLLAGAIDRCLTLHWPLWMHRLTRNHAMVAVLASLAAAILVSLPMVAITGHRTVLLRPGSNASILCGINFDPKSNAYYIAMIYRLLIAGDSSIMFIAPALAVNLLLTFRIVSIARQRRRIVQPGGWPQPCRPCLSREDISASLSIVLITLVYFLVCIPKIIGIRGLYESIENPLGQVETRFLINLHDISDLLLQFTGTVTVIIVFRQIRAFRKHFKAILRC